MMGVYGILCTLLVVLGSAHYCTAYYNASHESYKLPCNQDELDYRAYPYDCHKYIACEDNSLVVLDCPNIFIWNEDRKACDFAANTECHQIPFPEPDCSDGKNSYWRYPFDCALFWECMNNQLYLLPCPDDYFWDDAIKKCDINEAVDCSYVVTTSAKPTSAAPDTSTSATQSTPSQVPTESTAAPGPYTTPDLICTDENNYFPYIYDCSKYYECSNGVPVLMDCPKGEFWNIKLNNCDWPQNVDCSYVVTTSGASTVSTEAPTKAPTEAPTDVPTDAPTEGPGPYYTTPEIICKEDNTYFPYIFDCSKYYECSNGQPILMTCPAGQLWSNLLKTCDWPANVDCSYVVTTPGPDTATTY
ncbi:probable chitinase 10 isoform X3 [Diabrotica virgifera virgifera]|uniref:Chitin-binding type-2 domain-containing protein n=1 Tax=Diabrotica virgifera virgifera TaxID=50390 RepID=A0ABM5K4I0_DIAVI|nr:probable chitinase 10 isoform X3 [Diabrotica virgifera virgifera]